MSVRYESPPTSGWTKRRSSSFRPSSSIIKNGNLPIAPPSSSACSSVSSMETVVITSPAISNRQLAKSPARYLFIFLVGALLFTLGNSFFMSSQLQLSDDMSSGIKRQQPGLASYQKSDNQDRSSKATKDDDVSHHYAQNQPLPQNSQSQQPAMTSPQERQHATMRQAELAIAQKLSLVRDGQDVSNRIQSCRGVNCHGNSLQETDQLVYYNSLDRPRFVCGLRLEPKGMLIFNRTSIATHACPQHPRRVMATLFPILPTLANHQESSLLPPIQIGIRGVKPSRSTRFSRFRNCNVKCSFLPNNLNSQAIARTIVGTDWEIVSSMEGPDYYQSLQRQQQQDHVNHYSSTTSLDSDIPLPYFSWDDYVPNGRADVPGVDYDKAIKGAVFMARNCQSKNQREALVRDLIHLSNSSTLRVDSISRCLHNQEPPPIKTKDDKNEILSKYLFYLAFENQNAKDYITEKLWGSLFRSGTLPIYYGAPNVADHVPPHSIINVRDFPDLHSFWNYLVQVASNRTLYESYHAWRNKPLPSRFVQLYNFTHTHSTCRMARWAFAKLYGWGWDHASQTIQEGNVLDKRKLCWNNLDGLLTHPFRERWFSHTFRELKVQKEQTMNIQSMSEDATCYNPSNQAQDQTFSIVMVGSIRRTVWSHDGLVDVFLEPINNAMAGRTIILEMGVPFLMKTTTAHTSWNRMNHYELWIQSDDLRMTILTSQRVVLTTPNEGVIQMFIQVPERDNGSSNQQARASESTIDATFRMRVVIEKVDVSRPSGKLQSFFGKVAAEDFFYPVEKFLVRVGDSPSTGEEKL